MVMCHTIICQTFATLHFHTCPATDLRLLLGHLAKTPPPLFQKQTPDFLTLVEHAMKLKSTLAHVTWIAN